MSEMRLANLALFTSMREGQAADANHVAALLIVGVGVEQVVGDVLEDLLEERRR